MIAKLAFANVKRSYKEYLLYFLTLMIGVAVFYAFNSITAQSAVLDMSETQSTMIEFVGLLISGVSVFITVILAFLVVYANRFLIKRRNKEFALYLLLGMRKTTLLKMTFAETFFVGAFSLVVGLLLGLLLSQALLFLTAFLFSVEFSGFTFLIAWEQIAKTVIVFLIIFALALFVNLGYLAKARLITLLQSDKKNDDFKLRSIPLSFALFLLLYWYRLLSAREIRPRYESSVLCLYRIGCSGNDYVLLFVIGLFVARSSEDEVTLLSWTQYVCAASGCGPSEYVLPFNGGDLFNTFLSYHERVRRHQHLQRYDEHT